MIESRNKYSERARNHKWNPKPVSVHEIDLFHQWKTLRKVENLGSYPEVEKNADVEITHLEESVHLGPLLKPQLASLDKGESLISR